MSVHHFPLDATEAREPFSTFTPEDFERMAAREDVIGAQPISERDHLWLDDIVDLVVEIERIESNHFSPQQSGTAGRHRRIVRAIMERMQGGTL